MATAESVKTKLLGLIDSANTTTGNTDTDLTTAVASLITGFGHSGGGETFPQKIYETDFILETSITSGTSTICTISTGLSDTSVINNHELLFVVITCEPDDASSGYYARCTQMVCDYLGDLYPNPNAAAATLVRSSGEIERRGGNDGVRLATMSKDVSTIKVDGRCGVVPVAAGNYHLEIYRTGVTQ